MAGNHMDVDAPTSMDIPSQPCGLKRSSSAPMINTLVSSSPLNDTGGGTRRSISPPFTPTSGSAFRPVDSTTRVRDRSLSGSSCSLATTPVKIASRLYQIKQEEQVGSTVDREVAHEREVQSSLQISQSWEDMNLNEAGMTSMADESATRRPRSLSDSLHILTTGFPVPSSPSPTVGKQCFSPSMQQHMCVLGGGTLFSAVSPTPSPTRRQLARRSLSPIVNLRPSALSLKRKIESEPVDGFLQSPKRLTLCNVSGVPYCDRASATCSHLASRISFASDDSSNSDANVAGSTCSSSAPLPAGGATSRLNFSTDATSGTDSESSDMSSIDGGGGANSVESLDDSQHSTIARGSRAHRPMTVRQTSVP